MKGLQLRGHQTPAIGTVSNLRRERPNRIYLASVPRLDQRNLEEVSKDVAIHVIGVQDGPAKVNQHEKISKSML